MEKLTWGDWKFPKSFRCSFAIFLEKTVYFSFNHANHGMSIHN